MSKISCNTCNLGGSNSRICNEDCKNFSCWSLCSEIKTQEVTFFDISAIRERYKEVVRLDKNRKLKVVADITKNLYENLTTEKSRLFCADAKDVNFVKEKLKFLGFTVEENEEDEEDQIEPCTSFFVSGWASEKSPTNNRRKTCN